MAGLDGEPKQETLTTISFLLHSQLYRQKHLWKLAKFGLFVKLESIMNDTEIIEEKEYSHIVIHILSLWARSRDAKKHGKDKSFFLEVTRGLLEM